MPKYADYNYWLVNRICTNCKEYIYLGSHHNFCSNCGAEFILSNSVPISEIAVTVKEELQ